MRIAVAILLALSVAGCGRRANRDGAIDVVLIQRFSGLPAPGVTIYSSTGGRILDSALTDQEGRASVVGHSGGELTAHFVNGESDSALTLGDVSVDREYTLVWLWPRALGDIPQFDLTIHLSEPLAYETRMGIGGCNVSASLITGTSGTITAHESCKSPNEPLLVYASEANRYAVTTVATQDTLASLVFQQDSGSNIVFSGSVPSALQGAPLLIAQVWPMHHGQNAESATLLIETDNPVGASFSGEHRVHTELADSIGTYVYIDPTPGGHFRRSQAVGLMNVINLDVLESDYCPFTELASASLLTAEEVHWTNPCTGDGTAVLLGRMNEGNTAQWVGIYPSHATNAYIPLVIPAPADSRIGAYFVRKSDDVVYDEAAFWGDSLPGYPKPRNESRTSSGIPVYAAD